MQCNPIAVEGTRLIVQLALDNKVCQEVVVSDKYREDSEVNRILETRNSDMLQKVKSVVCVVLIYYCINRMTTPMRTLLKIMKGECLKSFSA